MTSREKILSALNLQESNYIPIDFSGHRSSGISAIAYHKLRKHLGLPPKPIRIYDMVQQLAIVDEDVLDLFGVDTIEMGRGFLLDANDWKSWVLPDGTACEIPFYVNTKKKGDDWFVYTDNGLELGVQKKDCLYFEQNYFPLSDSPAGPEMISPDMYEKYALPYEKRIVDVAHQAGLPYTLHICGNTDIILPFMLQTGADAFELDYKTDVQKVYDVYHNQATLIGNIDPSGVLALGTVEDVRNKTLELLEIYKATNRFILNAGCAIPAETPSINLKTMIDAARNVS